MKQIKMYVNIYRPGQSLAARFFRSSSYGRRAFSVASSTMWNSLPRHLPDPIHITAAFGDFFEFVLVLNDY